MFGSWRKKEKLKRDEDVCIQISPNVRVNQSYILRERERLSKLKSKK